MMDWFALITGIVVAFILGAAVGFLLCAIGTLNSLADDGIDIELVDGKWQQKKENIYGIRRD